MEKIGDILLQKRISKSMTVKDIAEKTRISVRFIEKIEKNDFSSFPGEVYLFGFIRNIASTLNMKKDEINALLDNYKNQYSDDTNDKIVNENISREKKKNTTLVIIMGIIAIIFIIIFLVLYLNPNDKIVQISGDKNNTKEIVSDTYEMEFLDKRKEFNLIKTGDLIKIKNKLNIYLLSIININSSKIDFDFNGKKFICFTEQMLKLDLDKDGIYDISLVLKKVIDNKGYLAIEVKDTKFGRDSFEKIIKNGQKILIGNVYILEKDVPKKSIEVYIRASRLPSFLNYNIDASRQSSKTLKPGEYSIISAKNYMEITIGNYKSAEVVLNKYYLDLTKNSEGFSVTKIIQWVKNPENESLYSLVIKDY